MNMMYLVGILAVGLVFSPALTCAQTETGTLPQKTIGQEKPQLVPSLIVLNARGASLQDGLCNDLGTVAKAILEGGLDGKVEGRLQRRSGARCRA